MKSRPFALRRAKLLLHRYGGHAIIFAHLRGLIARVVGIQASKENGGTPGEYLSVIRSREDSSTRKERAK